MFDVVPKILPSQQLCEIAPDAISLLGKLKGQPERELVIFDSVADEKRVPRNMGAWLGLGEVPARHL